jgi:O-antigen ligase
MYVKIFGDIMLLLSCLVLSEPSEGGRLIIRDSIFFSNSNDLALALLISITDFGFLIYQKGVKAVIGILGSGVALVFIVKTESRGVFLAAIVVYLAAALVSRIRLKLLVSGLSIATVLLLFVSPANLRRLTLIVADPTRVAAESKEEESTLGSQAQRQELLKTSLLLTLRHPLLGVGPGQFAVAVDGDAAKAGKRSSWLGTHNTYTEVSSECGIPALLLYLGIILSCLGMNYRLYKRTSGSPGNQQAAGLCLCLFLGILAYSTATFFFHIAYSGSLPVLSGMSVCTYMAAQKLLPQDQPRSV